ncbi:MAG TPA: protein FdrA, partial [Bacillota bacterium]
LGFANAVRRGPVGIVAASGTGLQEVSVLLHRYGAGVSHGLGTGGRDLGDAVGGASFRAAMAVLARDPGTEVIVLISKPPSPRVAATVLADARAAGKPVVIHFLGEQRRDRQGNVHFAATLREAAALAAHLAGSARAPISVAASDVPPLRFGPGQRYLRGLYGGDTLCYEAVALLASRLVHPWTNTPLDPAYRVDGTGPSREDTLLDLGDDAFTVGRLHPMLDPEPRAKRLLQEAADPETAVLLLDVVLGYGAHADPASVLAPAVAEARSRARREGRDLAVVVALCGTDEDPQSAPAQAETLARAGALVQWSHEQAVLTALAALEQAGRQVRAVDGAGRPVAQGGPGTAAGPSPSAAAPEAGTKPEAASAPATGPAAPHAFIEMLNTGLVAVNAGVGDFAQALVAQQVPVVELDWRPPAAGDDRLRSLLERLR